MGLWQPLARHGPHPRPPLAGRPRRLIRKLAPTPPASAPPDCNCVATSAPSPTETPPPTQIVTSTSPPPAAPTSASTCATPTSTSSYSPPAPRDARATSYQPESSLDTPSHLTPAAAGPLTPHLPWDISTKTTTDTPGTPPPPKAGYSVPAPTTASH